MPLDTANRELVLAAQLIARPEFVNVLFPADAHSQAPDLRAIDSEAVRAVISLLSAHGSTYANPLAIQGALADLPQELDDDEVVTIVTAVPSPEEVSLEGVKGLRDDIADSFNRRQLAKQLHHGSQALLNGKRPADEVVSEVDTAVRDYQRGQVGTGTTADEIDEELGQGALVTRWKVAHSAPGGEFIDGQAKGKRPDGAFDCGLAGQSEIIALVAKYGVGKTRLALNWIADLIDDKTPGSEGASIDLLVLEDTKAAYAIKLMGIRFNIEPWLIEKHIIVSRSEFIAAHGVEDHRRVEEARQWFRDKKKRLGIIDGGARVNIFNYQKAKALLEERSQVFGRTHLLIDYVQQWPGDTPTQEMQGFGLRELASRYNVGLLLLSQVPNSAMDDDSVQAGVLPTKGTGTYGQIAHWGYLLGFDPAVGQRELRIQQQKGRNAGLNQFVAVMNVDTGKVLRYEGASMFSPSRPEGGKRKGGKRNE